ncbi:MAG: hypothetical protein F6K00_05135 [Leptolyngbya sp. SIOISBB]|nr:hypothetical protein [Leptolyngbya sp. SIOISBB]
MANSRQIAGLLGPTLAAALTAEFPLVQPHLHDAQIPPVVYLSGVLLFVAGLAIVRAHNLWVRARWPVLITTTGWSLLILGLIRMFAAGQYRQTSAEVSSTTFIVIEGILLVIALVITYYGYRREPQ